MDTITAYLLITVTGSGFVSHNTFPTQQQCDEAKSVALYGESVEQFKETDEKIAAAEKQYRQEFYANHPPREAKTKNEMEQVRFSKELAAKGGSYGSFGWSPCLDICGMSVTGDGKIQDEPGSLADSWSGAYSPDKGEWVQRVHSQWITKYPTDIKTAKCIKTTD